VSTRRGVAPAPAAHRTRRRGAGRRTAGRLVVLAAAVAAAVAAPSLLARPTTGAGAPPAAPAAAPPAAAAALLPSAPAFDLTARSTTDPASPWVVVNKQHPLDPLGYAPASLTLVAGKEVSSLAAPDLQAMLAAAEADGVRPTLVSGYRSYGHQERVHQRAVASQGVEQAERVSARPGHSEHQTGLAVDLGSRTDPSCDLQDCFGATPEGAWLAAHAASYGFLLRYTAADSDVTGYSPEAWHYRWVGADLLREMADRGVGTLEELFGVSGGPVYSTP